MATINAYHLRKTEVAYECKIRGLSTDGGAGELRKRLSQALSSNTAIDEDVVKELVAESELECCSEKYLDLLALVEEFEGVSKDREYQRLESRLTHLFQRVERIPADYSDEEDDEHKKEELLLKVKELLKLLASSGSQPKKTLGKQDTAEDKDKKTSDEGSSKMADEKEIDPLLRQQEIIHEDLSGGQSNEADTKNSNISVNRRKDGSEQRHEVEPQTKQQSNIIEKVFSNQGMQNAYSRTKSIPVYKWGIKFAHESKQSVGSFLERVEELRRARGVSEQELFDSAVDLFDGAALVWYRSTMGRIHSWNALCQEMRIVFQTPDYDFRLQQEIFSRMQGEHEPVDLFIAAMEGLYSRLSEQVPDVTKLKQIYNNLHPQLQDRLAMFEIKSVEELRMMGRKAEAGRLRALQGSMQNKSGGILEPDLAYSEPPRRRFVSTVQAKTFSRNINDFTEGTSRDFKCWNCGNHGHRFATCRQPRKKFCYGCGHPDKVRAECNKCLSKNVQRGELAPNTTLTPREN